MSKSVGLACALLVLASCADDSFDLNSVKAMTFRFEFEIWFGADWFGCVPCSLSVAGEGR